MLQEELTNKILGCTKCGIRETCKAPVIGYGDVSSPLVVIGEAPGFVEDCTGIPLVGHAELMASECALCQNVKTCLSWFLDGIPSKYGHEKCTGFKSAEEDTGVFDYDSIKTSGQLLDDTLEKFDLRRGDIYTLNTVCCRPYQVNPTTGRADNREPTATELLNCIPHMAEHLHNLKPKAIITLGWTATKVLVPKAGKLSSAVGQQFKKLTINLATNPIAIPNYHPSYILRAANNQELYSGLLDCFERTFLEALKISHG